MEDITTRAIIIGVSVLIAVATISSVMTYYSTAQDMVRRIGSGTDIAGLYDKGIENILLKNKATGIEVKNLYNYFTEEKNAEISFGVNLRRMGVNDEEFRDLVPTEYYKVEYLLTESGLKIEIKNLNLEVCCGG